MDVLLHDVVLQDNGKRVHVQYYVDNGYRPILFPDRTLALLFRANGSTTRGRFVRLAAKYADSRLLFSEKSKDLRLNYSRSDSEMTRVGDAACGAGAGAATVSTPGDTLLHGLVALNDLALVNTALKTWIVKETQRGTMTAAKAQRLVDVARNLRAVGLDVLSGDGTLCINDAPIVRGVHGGSFYATRLEVRAQLSAADPGAGQARVYVDAEHASVAASAPAPKRVRRSANVSDEVANVHVDYERMVSWQRQQLRDEQRRRALQQQAIQHERRHGAESTAAHSSAHMNGACDDLDALSLLAAALIEHGMY